jgi:hypothetical protein
VLHSVDEAEHADDTAIQRVRDPKITKNSSCKQGLGYVARDDELSLALRDIVYER